MTIWDTLTRTLRPMAEQSLDAVAKLEREHRAREAGGKITITYEPVAGLEAVPCRVRPLALPQQEGLSADQLTALERWTVAFPMATPIAEGMRITASGTDMDGNDWTRVLIIVAVDGPKSYEVLRNATAIDPNVAGR